MVGWEAEGFGRWCDGSAVEDGTKRPRGAGKSAYDVGVTGLSLCAFLGAGYTNRGTHPFARVVGKGLRYLKKKQDKGGCFGPRTAQKFIYNHAIGSLAMVEAYGMTGSVIYKGTAQRSIGFIELCRNLSLCVALRGSYWRERHVNHRLDEYRALQCEPRECVCKVARKAATVGGRTRRPLRVFPTGSTRSRIPTTDTLDTTRGPFRPPSVALPPTRHPPKNSEARTAIGVLARTFLGENPRKRPVTLLGVKHCLAKLPRWNPDDDSIDAYYWYFATLAMYQLGGRYWTTWNTALTKALIPSQHQKTTFCELKGSWDPLGPWGPDGGRVYSTAMLAMCLQATYRDARTFKSK